MAVVQLVIQVVSPSPPLYTYDKSNTHTDVPVYRRQFCGTADAPRFDMITRVKDGMMDLLFGNESKGISAIVWR